MISPSTRSALEARTLLALQLGPLTAAEIAGAIGCSHDAAYLVLAGLRNQGHVTVDYVRLRGTRGSGRVASVYQLVSGAPRVEGR